VIKHIIKPADHLVPGDRVLDSERKNIVLTVSVNDSESEKGVTFVRGQGASLSYSEWTWFASDPVAVADPRYGTTVQRFEILIDWESRPEPDDEALMPDGVKTWVGLLLGKTGRVRNVEVKEVLR
jgi:hypothetical protein